MPRQLAPSGELLLPLAGVAGLGEAVAALGTPRFGQALLRALSPLIVIDQLAIVTCGRTGPPRTLCVASRVDLSLARSLTREYVITHHGADPLLKDLLDRRWTRAISVSRHDPTSTPPAYEARFFGGSGLIDKLALRWWSGATAFYVNFYRLDASGRYGARDVAVVEGLRDLIASLVRAHEGRQELRGALRHEGSPPAVEALVALLHADLTAREQQVLSQILLGVPTEGAAGALGVKPSTIVTLRRRAYAKLGIATQAELFRLCLGALPAL